MCFRPTTVSKPMECPNCGKKVSALNGIVPKRCPYCKEPLPEEQIECPQCGASNPKSATVCAGCGITATELKALAAKTKMCPNCGTSNKGLAKACMKCGAELPF